MNYNEITWARFESCNPNKREAFESMSRMLFNDYFFAGKGLLHSNSNNPGIEVEPIKLKDSGKRISFQSKYFDSKIDYSQIKDSAEKIVKYYKGKLDILYLYSNKELTKTSKSYEKIEGILNEDSIEIKLINNKMILDQVMGNNIIGKLFFKKHGLTDAWFHNQNDISLGNLGTRYNKEFNIETSTSKYINLFSKNLDGLDYINNKKDELVYLIRKNLWQFTNYGYILRKLSAFITDIEDIKFENISECLNWSILIQDKFCKEIKELKEKIKEKKFLLNNYIEKKDKIIKEIEEMEKVLDYFSKLDMNEQEKGLIINKILIIEGEAGVGKSQLFANASKKNLENGIYSILLLGNTFLTSDTLHSQILKNLDLDMKIDEFLDIVEGIGENKNQCIVIFIDAINEMFDKEIWKIGYLKFLSKINKLKYVKLALSVRSGYGKLLFSENLSQEIETKKISRIIHQGFKDESLEATKTFLNHYDIPFIPTQFLQYEMTNPLFLTIFCKTYQGKNVDVFSVFDRMIKLTDEQIQKTLKLEGTISILNELIYEIAEIELKYKKRNILKKEIFCLEFWDTYGLTDKKIKFVSELEKSGIILSYVYNDLEEYQLSYNLLNDYILAKVILKTYNDKVKLENYIEKDLLDIDNGEIKNLENIDVFVVVANLFAEKYNDECIKFFENITNEYDKREILSRYLESFKWRKSENINKDNFKEFLFQNEFYPKDVWEVLIENSTKENHPLNAKFLHEMLIKKTISERDFIWTIYINELSWEEERVFQIIKYFDEGNEFSSMNDVEEKLLLILFTWLLSSSNRVLRDKTSKAMVEILKRNFHLCISMLTLFEHVDDPYIKQRLYGVIFGACTKRIDKYEKEYDKLAKFVYDEIFDKDIVYPDALLRDYARLIIERYLYEFPENNNSIMIAKINPPYKSKKIPKIKEGNLNSSDYSSGISRITRSMTPDGEFGAGMYGDFGRYVFQSALEKFEDIDIRNLFNYSIKYIIDELGYTNELFSEYDSSLGYRDRHYNKKIERIGKKYQWIAFYNVFASISDEYLIKGWEDDRDSFKGAWNPYIRDFDPTLNYNFLKNPDTPLFKTVDNSENELMVEIDPASDLIRNWSNKKSKLFENHRGNLLLTDESGKEWVLLQQHKEINNKERQEKLYSDYYSNGYQSIWSMSHSYIVDKGKLETFKENLDGKNYFKMYFPFQYSQSVYELFNREYFWSSGYDDCFKKQWIDYEIDTDEEIVTKKKINMPKFVKEESNNPDTINEIVIFEEEEIEVREKIKKKLGMIMSPYSRVLWEEEYDASEEETTAFYIPCGEIVSYLELKQKEYDGYFYNNDNELVVFDGNIAGVYDGLLIMKKQLEKYLDENNLSLFWMCQGSKSYRLKMDRGIISDWTGFFYLENGKVKGEYIKVRNTH